MDDLFSIKAQAREHRGSHGWRSLLPMRATTLGVPYTDAERAERMRVALVGLHLGQEAGLFMDILTGCLAEDRMAMRVFTLREPAPARVPGAKHLSARAQQCVRDTFARGEDRGYLYLPFKVRMHKQLPSGPLQHGCLLLGVNGFDLALVSGGTKRATVREWPVVEARGWIPGAPQRGCPFVVGDSEARSSWDHLSAHGALAVYPTDSKQLWVFKMLPDQHFPTPFDLSDLRRRAAGGNLPGR